nr:hypothetical protein [Enterococcus innesii]
MSYEQHMAEYEKLCKEWHEENDRPPEARKALKYIDSQKKRQGIA